MEVLAQRTLIVLLDDGVIKAMNKRELHNAVNKDMTEVANRVADLKKQKEQIEKDIEYWSRQEEAARTMSIRLDMEAGKEGI